MLCVSQVLRAFVVSGEGGVVGSKVSRVCGYVNSGVTQLVTSVGGN